MIEPLQTNIPITRQCQLLALPRSSFYYRPASEPEENLEIMNRIDKIYTAHPFLGGLKITEMLCRKLNRRVNHKRVERLMRKMGLSAIRPKKRCCTSSSDKKHRKYPYLLGNLQIVRPNHVWGTDITYIPLQNGFCYLVALIDWYSRHVISWEISNTLETAFCLKALDNALELGKPEIHNSDQGCQFTSLDYTERLQAKDIKISMDGQGRCFDNIFTERLWRSVKWEDVYLKGYEAIPEVRNGLREYFQFYNTERPHQSLGYKTPAEVYFGA